MNISEAVLLYMAALCLCLHYVTAQWFDPINFINDGTTLPTPDLESSVGWGEPLEPVKRGGCQGFPCMFTHMGDRAGRSSIRKLKLTILRECISDPLCFAAGRRKRAVDERNYARTNAVRPESLQRIFRKYLKR